MVNVTRVYVPQFFVSSQQRFGVTDIKALRASLGSWTNCVTALRQISATALFYLEASRRIHPRSVRACQPKDAKREWRSVPACRRERELTHWVGGGAGGEKEHIHTGERERESTLAPPFICFFLPLGLPYANWA